MDPIKMPSAFASLKIRFESSTVVLIKVAAFGVAVGAAVLAM
jgi:hypothetical protein